MHTFKRGRSRLLAIFGSEGGIWLTGIDGRDDVGHTCQVRVGVVSTVAKLQAKLGWMWVEREENGPVGRVGYFCKRKVR